MKPTKTRISPPKRGHKGCLVLVVLVVVLLAAAAFGAFSIMQDVNGRDQLGDEVLVTVQQGENSASIARSLKDAGVIKYPNIFRYYLKYTGKSANLQYGDFTLVQGQSYDSIIETMSQYAKRETVSVTFPEGITAQRFAQLMEEAGLCTAEEFLDVANNGDFSQYEFWNEIPEDPNRFMKCEGYLFPDTSNSLWTIRSITMWTSSMPSSTQRLPRRCASGPASWA